MDLRYGYASAPINPGTSKLNRNPPRRTSHPIRPKKGGPIKLFLYVPGERAIDLQSFLRQ